MSGLQKQELSTGRDLSSPSLPSGTQILESSSEWGGESQDIRPFVLPRQRPKSLGTAERTLDSLELTSDFRDSCMSLARQARDAFEDACSPGTDDESESNLASTKRFIEELWAYAYLRDQPFRDLLALIDAALKRASLADLNPTQRDVLIQAFSSLPRWMLEETTVDEHRDRFAEYDIDILGPLRTIKGKRVRVTVEDIEKE